MDPSNDLVLEVRSEPRLLASIRSLVRGWVGAFGLAEEVVQEVVLAIDEACTNAIRHSYKNRNDETIELRLRSTPEFLEFEVSDQGEPCPSHRVERRELEPPDASEVTPGGLGVQLMYKVFDDVRFSTDGKCGNCVVLRLNRQH